MRRDPDSLYEKSRAAGLRIERDMEDTGYGSRTFTVRALGRPLDLRDVSGQWRREAREPRIAAAAPSSRT